MEEDKSSSRKRPLSLLDDEGPSKPPLHKKPRFPKGKKIKAAANEVVSVIGAAPAPAPAPVDLSDPQAAAKERAKRRSQMTTELFSEEGEIPDDVTQAEIKYEDNGDFVDDGIKIEPFNLNQEREEGYFDADGNFVEYANQNDIKDAWLDSVDVDTTYSGKNSEIPKIEEPADLSSEDIGKMKRRIADLLEPNETVLQALRRLKGTSTGRKDKMPEEIKVLFDQLTEDSVKLMENGDYNVYHEKREVFLREAEGYERIARAKEGTSVSENNDDSGYNVGNDVFPNVTNVGLSSVTPLGPGFGPSDMNTDTTQNLNENSADDFDMFAEDDQKHPLNQSINDSSLGSGSTAEPYSQLQSESLHTNIQNGDAENDYVYDEASGYYYSSALGYYYDPASGMYCCANSGKWYSYNEQTNLYDEIQSEIQ